MAVVTVDEPFEAEVEFLLDRLSWFDFVAEDNIPAWDDWAWAVVDHEVLLARSALELLRDRLSERALAMMAAADAQWRAHPKAFDHMFRRAIDWARPDDILTDWVRDETGATPPIPPSHWWWRLSKNW
ncbi:hypothetical protein SAMN04488120_101325 [Fontimonas thermophila]|uniref:Uncharacterized protein n=1 Tax=Fontimonas thermophila TaxID=1076937 RepID=A0A1I2HES3_9GAMM|nr:hypothetical protein [Fontimonas thermophila]SFF27417.1 hypothetical protein SAMN04488120_101325 [Fontimonas thermophila]